ncbi:hypothetical protein BDW74DRAFT_189457 [Aspergillus multicolor]|uniref:uncharacterized protein n=1 Tax=Aspergillus multicolor TaxID=41759 RepID=UPI003CCD8513
MSQSLFNLMPGYLAQKSRSPSFAQVTAVTALATFFVIVRKGACFWRRTGLHLDDWLIILSLMYFFAAYNLYATTLAITKVSILTMYYPLLPTRFIKWSAAVLGVVIAVWWPGCLFTSFFGCLPCLDRPKLFSGKAVPNFTTDFVILVLPLVEVRKLHLRAVQKIGLIVAFLTGGLGCVASVMRFTQLRNIHIDRADAFCTVGLIISLI